VLLNCSIHEETLFVKILQISFYGNVKETSEESDEVIFKELLVTVPFVCKRVTYVPDGCRCY
jgi:hypothetical protein